MSLRVAALTCRYPGTNRPAVADVAFTVAAGQVCALVGPNGAGKSTVLKVVVGLVKAQLGTASLDAPDARIAYLPQAAPTGTGLTALEVVLLGRLGRLGLRVNDGDLAAAMSALAATRTDSLATRGLDELSGGELQRVMLAQALVRDPTALVLDEPTSNLDLAHQLDALHLVRAETHARRMTTLMVLHDLTLAARFADVIAVLRDGRLVTYGPPAEVLNAELLAEVWGVAARVHHDAETGTITVIPLHSLSAA
ncbi:ABC transporter ATP-binding protein [Shumkonia mesophila]|uniref:ABC transporter ATP-binding protein n=1 Tax=Shumkonia mesophila TaxID=2838854 RepID=UPI0029350AD3|nr:ABC transporter ATP-binding protein [Shumkonia mesophila]